jgi:hypothetical protein
MPNKVLVAALAALVAGCAAPRASEDTGALAAESRQAAAGLQQQLAGKLMAAIKAGGPASAIEVCKTLAPEAAGQKSRETGWRITRVSLKPRNPALGAPDAWEQQVLARLDARAASGEKPDALEHSEIVNEPQGRYFRYMKALPVAQLCVNCHGSADKLQPAIKERLATDYPHDRATGYSPGQLRGAISVKRPL